MAKYAGHLCHPDSLGLNCSGFNFPCPLAYTPLLVVLAGAGLKATVISKRGRIMKERMLVLGLNDAF